MRTTPALAAATCSALAAAVAALLPGAAFAAATPFAASTGDTVGVAGTPIACVSTGGSSGRGVLCSLLGPGDREPAGSVGVALSSHGEAIVVQFAAKGPREVWRVKAAHRAPAVAPRVHITDVGGSWQVALTDIRCEVRRAGLQPGVVCSRFDEKGPRAHSNSIAITRLRVGIYRYDGKRRAVMKVEEAEPARLTQAVRRTQARAVAAPSRATPATPNPVELAVGDTLLLPRSRITCLVTSDGTKPALYCLLVARQTTPLPNSYAVGLARDGTAILVAYDAKSRGSLLRRFTQAAVARVATAAKGKIVLAKLGGLYHVTGTDILCAVSSSGNPGLACYMVGPQGRIVGSPGIAMVDGVSATVFRLTSRTAITTLIRKPEPAAK